jgi:hypothetical protein
MSEEDKLVNINEKVIVLKGILQTFDNTYHSTGRIYPASAFIGSIIKYRTNFRKSKIKRIFDEK